MRCSVQPMARRHLKAVASLEKACFGEEAWPVELFAQLLGVYKKGKGFRGGLWVSVDPRSGGVLGYMGLDVSPLGEAELSNLAVSPAFRRRGVGRKLVALAISTCREHGVALLWLRVRPSNEGAVRFYKSCGFQLRGKFCAYYDLPPEDALIMALEIPDGVGYGNTAPKRGPKHGNRTLHPV